MTEVCTPAEAAVRFINAGGDLILCCGGIAEQEEIASALYTAFEDGTIAPERLDESAARILRLKLSLGLIGC